MLERKAGATTDDESDSTDDESDAGNGYPLGWGWLPTIEEDVPFAGNVSPVAGPPHKIMSSPVCNARDTDEVQPDASDAACRSAVGESRLGVICAQSILTALDM